MNANKTNKANNTGRHRRGVTFKNNVNVREINREGKGNPVTGMQTRTRRGSVRVNPIINQNRTRGNASAALIAAHAWKLGETVEDMYEVVDRSAASAEAKSRAKMFIWNKWSVIQNMRRPPPTTAPANYSMYNEDLYS